MPGRGGKKTRCREQFGKKLTRDELDLAMSYLAKEQTFDVNACPS
jgi:hypothetical protein